MALPGLGIATGILGGAASIFEGNKGRRAANTAARDALALYGNIDIPSITEQEISLLLPELVGEYDPEVLAALGLGPSAMEEVSTDPLLRNQQMDALSKISEVAQGGLTEADMAAARDINRQVSQSDQARKQAILQNLAQRGVLGSGMELAAQMAGAQQASEQQASASDQLIQQAQARALQAMAQQGNMASQVRGQDFGEQSRIAQARDAINQFNIQNRQNVMGQNVGERNRAQQMNLGNRQAIENARKDLQNQQQMYNKQLLQQKFQNELARANPQAEIISNRGKQQQQAHSDTAAGIAQIAGGGMKGLFGLGK